MVSSLSIDGRMMFLNGLEEDVYVVDMTSR